MSPSRFPLSHGIKRQPNISPAFRRAYDKMSKADLAELAWELAVRLNSESYDVSAQDEDLRLALLAEEARILANNGLLTVNCARRLSDVAGPSPSQVTP